MIMHGPAVFEMKVHIINHETGQRAVMTVGLGAGKYPTKGDIDELMEKLKDDIEDHAPGFEMMDRREFMADMIEQYSGNRMYVAGPNSWDHPDMTSEGVNDE